MNEEQRQLLNLAGRPPARLTARQVAWMLNFGEHDIPVLVAARLLKPLGNPPANGPKFFAEVEIRALAADRVWLAKATNAIHQYWLHRNGRRNGGRSIRMSAGKDLGAQEIAPHVNRAAGTRTDNRTCRSDTPDRLLDK